MRNHGRFATAHVHVAPAWGSEDSYLINCSTLEWFTSMYTEHYECLMYASWLLCIFFAFLCHAVLLAHQKSTRRGKRHERFLLGQDQGPMSAVAQAGTFYDSGAEQRWSSPTKRVSFWNAKWCKVLFLFFILCHCPTFPLTAQLHWLSAFGGDFKAHPEEKTKSVEASRLAPAAKMPRLPWRVAEVLTRLVWRSLTLWLVAICNFTQQQEIKPENTTISFFYVW